MGKFFQPVRRLVANAKQLDISAILHKEVLTQPVIQAQLVDLNTKQLYDKGIDSAGNFLGTYSPYTIEYKTKIAGGLGRDVRADHITLKDTGDFYRSLKFVDQSNAFIISGDTVKEDGTDLSVEYGKKILGLTNESIQEIRPELQQRIAQSAREKILKDVV